MRFVYMTALIFIFLYAQAENPDSNKRYLQLQTEKATNFIKINPDSTRIIGELIQQEAHQMRDEYYEALGFYLQGHGFYQLNQRGESFVKYHNALQIINKDKSETKENQDLYIKLLVNTSVILRQYQEYYLSIEYLHEVLHFVKQENRREYLWNAYFSMAKSLHAQGREYQLAISYLDSAIALAVDEEDVDKELNARNQKGLVYTDQEKYTEARSIYQDILEYENKADSAYPFYERLAYHNIGNSYLQVKDYSHAETYLLQAAKSSTIPRLEFLTYMDLCEVFLNQEQPEKAEFYGRKAEELYSQVNVMPINYKLFTLLSSLYFKRENHSKSFFYSQKHITEGKKFLQTQQQLTEVKNEYDMVTLAAIFLTSIEEKPLNSFSLFISTLGLLITMALLLGKVWGKIMPMEDDSY